LSLSLITGGCGHGYTPTTVSMSRTHHWKTMSFCHCIRNGIAFGKSLLHPLNHILKHPIVVQITQDSHYFPTEEKCGTFPPCSKDKKIGSNELTSATK
jgi:hypothetical protein